MSVCRETLCTGSIDEQEREGGKEGDGAGRLARCGWATGFGGLVFMCSPGPGTEEW